MNEKKQVEKNEKLPSNKEIVSVIYKKTFECYGVLGITRFDSQTRNDYPLLDEKKASLGIIVTKTSTKTFNVDIYLVLANGVKLSETIFEYQKVMRYFLNKKFNNGCSRINVFAMSVK